MKFRLTLGHREPAALSRCQYFAFKGRTGWKRRLAVTFWF